MRQYDFGAGGFIIDVYIEQHYPPCLTYWHNHITERRDWKQTWHKAFAEKD